MQIIIDIAPSRVTHYLGRKALSIKTGARRLRAKVQFTISKWRSTNIVILIKPTIHDPAVPTK